MLEARGPCGTPSATLRSNSRTESVLEVRCANALKSFRCSAVLKGACRTAGFRVWLLGCSFTPLWRSREAQEPEARAKPASTTDSAQLSDRSERSERREFCAGLGLRASQGTPSFARGDGAGATFCLLFGRSKRRSPAGANSRLGLTRMPTARKANRGHDVVGVYCIDPPSSTKPCAASRTSSLASAVRGRTTSISSQASTSSAHQQQR
jgi:hypothetical protein